MQNLLPCKSSPQNRCDVTHGNGVIYEDLTNIRPRALPQPSMEVSTNPLVDVIYFSSECNS